VNKHGKWNGIKKKKKAGTFIDKLGYIKLLEAITHVEISNTIKCILYIAYDYSIPSLLMPV
jgi:hypothetical protein